MKPLEHDDNGDDDGVGGWADGQEDIFPRPATNTAGLVNMENAVQKFETYNMEEVSLAYERSWYVGYVTVVKSAGLLVVAQAEFISALGR